MRSSLVTPLGLALALTACQKDGTDAETTPPKTQAAPPTQAPSAPASRPSGSPAAPSGGAPLTGTVKLGEGVSADAVKKSDVLYIMARKSQGGGLAGGLVAVKKMGNLDAKSFPVRFELGAKDAMMMGTPFAGPFVVYARLDADGDPMTKTDEDLYATVAEPVKNGASDLELVLEHGEPKTVPAPPGGKAPPSAAPSSKPAQP